MIKLLGQLLGLWLGFTFSPCWMLMKTVLNGFFDLEKAIQGPLYMLSEFRHFMSMVSANPEYTSHVLIPMMIGVLILNIVVAVACSRAGGLLVSLLTQKLRPAGQV